mgnify:FL=1
MITKEHETKKYCLFYASDFHLEMILLPYIKKNIYKDKFLIFTQENLSESMEILLNRTNLDSDEKNMMLNLNWDGKENLEEKDLNNYTIIINGNNEYISEINDKINKINPDKINIIDCYSINDENLEPRSIQEKYDDILNTQNYKNL